MARLFLIRHGEPEEQWGEVGGDAGLSALGRSQAAATAERLKDLRPFRILSSPLKRAHETAAATAQLVGESITTEPRIGEIATPTEVVDRRAWLRELMVPGKRWREAGAQLAVWRDDLLNAVRGIDDDTAMFSHFVAINVITGAALNSDAITVCRPDLASISEFEIENGKIRLVRGAPLEGGADAT